MSRNTSDVLGKLMEALDSFGVHISDDKATREKVLLLLQSQDLFRELGVSLTEVPADGDAARDRLRQYLLENPRTPLSTKEFSVVGGISEYGKRIREIRVQEGYHIWTGLTVRAMLKEGDVEEGDLPPEVLALSPSEYYLVDTEPDLEAAARWKVVDEVRRMNVSDQDKLLTYLRRYTGQMVSGEELSSLVKGSEWARRVRELRTEEGWPVKTKHTGRRDLPGGYYILEADRQSPPHDRGIKDVARKKVLKRDGFSCRKCGWNRETAHADDPSTFLELHHIEHHAKGGKNNVDNLIALCDVCHDDVHRHPALEDRDKLFAWLEE